MRLGNSSPKLIIVGNSGGTNVGESLRRAAHGDGYSVRFFDAYGATGKSRIFQSIAWRLFDRRPMHLNRFSAEVVRACARERPDILVATGAAPLTKSCLHALHAMGIFSINYSTDDPFNAHQLARWHLSAIASYDLVCTTRRANLIDLRRLGCKDVRYVPFGYDESLFAPPSQLDGAIEHDVLFAGGADRDRVKFMTSFLKCGAPIALIGDYWHRYKKTRPYALGFKSPGELCRLTAAAKVNLCLVRHANRDGHVMRSFEIAAVGGCMLVEETEEHKAIFGSDGQAVRYFKTPEEAATRAKLLCADPTERTRLAISVRTLVTTGAHTYRDRLTSMLDSAAGHVTEENIVR